MPAQPTLSPPSSLTTQATTLLRVTREEEWCSLSGTRRYVKP